MSGIMNMLLGARTAIAVAVDEFFNRVTLLLPGDGTNGAQNNTFLDSSTNNFTITRNGNTTQGTFSPFSQTGWSNYFNTPSTDWLNLGSNANFSFGTGAYTIEFFVYPTTAGSADTVFLSIEASGTGWYISRNNNAGVALNLRGVATVVSTNSYQIPLNTWTHVVITRASTSTNQTRIFINGVLAVAGTDTTNWSATGPLYLMTTGVSGYNAGGYLSNVRLIKGSIPTAYQTSSTTAGTSVFTPPTSILSTSSQGATSGDVSLLTCQNNRFVDNSSTNATITLVGTPSIQPFSPFLPTIPYSAAAVGGSGYFDGTGDYLSVPDNVAFTMGAGDFTIEAWVYVTATSGSQAIFGTSNAAGSAGSMSFVLLAQNSSGFPTIGVGYLGTIYTATSSEALVKNQWNHIAGVRNGATVSIYVNGVSRGTLNMGTLTITDSTEIVGIGRNGDFNGEYLTGYISSARIVKGTAVYTANFTPPTAPLTAVTNTQLLTNFTNAGIIDATADNVLETLGNAQISTTQSKFGGSSMSFDGSGDYLTTPSVQNNELGAGDFTIEFWMFPNNTSSAYRALVSSENYSATTGGWSLYQNGTAIEFWLSPGGSATLNATSAVTANTWQHLALCRASGTLRLFVNGTQAQSVSNSTTLTGRQVWIGGNNSGSFFFNGYIDDLRVTRFARYTSNFTAPTAAFPTQ
jgi:hypothetical protein